MKASTWWLNSCREDLFYGFDLCEHTAFVIPRLPCEACGKRISQIMALKGVKPMEVSVRDNNVDQALRALKKKLQREGVYREMKMRRFYEKPSEKRAREQAAAVRRARKLERKRLERDGVVAK